MKDINTEIEKTLRSWDNIKRFQSTPFLYTRIEQKIKDLETPPQKTSWIWVWQPLLIAVLVAINFFTIASAFSNNETQSQSVYEVIADQYNLSIEDSQINYEL